MVGTVLGRARSFASVVALVAMIGGGSLLTAPSATADTLTPTPTPTSPDSSIQSSTDALSQPAAVPERELDSADIAQALKAEESPQPGASIQSATGSTFEAGRIISDSVFFNGSRYSGADVQNFLNSQLSSCGNSQGYACIRDYWQATPSRAATAYCQAYNGLPSESAASIIARVGAACGINQQVILVMLQKEQSLITSGSPSAYQYRSAMGYGCPDTAACDSTYYGFFNQVYAAASQFQRYTKNPSSWRYQAGKVNSIYYNPNAACGTANVYIQNQATANLYIYTPYTPNQAALNNLYGSGDGCSAYGNRNFWRFFTDWFGSTISGIDAGDATSLIKALYQDILGRQPDPVGLADWQNKLVGQGQPVISVVNGILYGDEYYVKQIAGAYQDVLHRSGDPVGNADWLNRMRRGSTNVDDIRMTFTRSPEYYANAGGTDRGFISTMYTTLLKRTPSDTEMAYWLNWGATYGMGNIPPQIWNSYESGTNRIDAIYQTFLGRSVDSAGISSWVPLITSQGESAARSAVVNSLEYLQRSRSRFPQ